MNTKKKKKICYNCKKQSSNLKKGIVSKKIASWKKKLGLKTKLPGDIYMPLKISYPKKYNTILKLDLSKKNANKYVYYYASQKNEKKCLNTNHVINAYGEDFSNKGVAKCNKDGKVLIKLDCPQTYHINNKNQQHISHIHYLISNEKNEWDETLYTETIICSIDKKNLKFEELSKKLR